jgi:hypothetical protein
VTLHTTFWVQPLAAASWVRVQAVSLVTGLEEMRSLCLQLVVLLL